MAQQLPKCSSPSLFGRGSKAPPRWRKLVVPLAVWVVAASVGGTVAWFQCSLPNFGCVEPGVLYRSGQPDARALCLIQERCGIRTIVNLRSARKVTSDPDAREETAYARENGINFVNLPYNDGLPEGQVEKFLQLMKDPSRYPVLVHCAEGKERAGVMVAAYRICVNGWSAQDALAEMKRFGFKPEEKPEMVSVVEGFPKAQMPRDIQYQGSSAPKH